MLDDIARALRFQQATEALPCQFIAEFEAGRFFIGARGFVLFPLLL